MKVKTKDILAKDVLAENEIALLKKRMNAGEKVDLNDRTYSITGAQAQKGLAWLMNLWKTPQGVIRKSNPFGLREETALEEFAGFELTGFYDAGNSIFHFYVPIYVVVSKDENGTRTGFEYYVSGGEINIIG